jgi:hypothetical protein
MKKKSIPKLAFPSTYQEKHLCIQCWVHDHSSWFMFSWHLKHAYPKPPLYIITCIQLVPFQMYGFVFGGGFGEYNTLVTGWPHRTSQPTIPAGVGPSGEWGNHPCPDKTSSRSPWRSSHLPGWLARPVWPPYETPPSPPKTLKITF